jgi:hypothetical protein
LLCMSCNICERKGRSAAEEQYQVN